MRGVWHNLRDKRQDLRNQNISQGDRVLLQMLLLNSEGVNYSEGLQLLRKSRPPANVHWGGLGRRERNLTTAILTTLLTLVVLCVVGHFWRSLWRRVKVPPAVSLIVLGVLLGTSVADLLPTAWETHGPTLSRVAFCLLLLRAGIAFDKAMLQRIIRHSIGFGTIPVTAELVAVMLLSRGLLFDTWSVALLGGFLIAAVSPAVVLPTMLAVKERGLDNHAVPDRIMGQTIVNSFVAQAGILITINALSPTVNGPSTIKQLLTFPISLIGGLAVGVLFGYFLPVKSLLSESKIGKSPQRYLFTAIAVGAGLIVYFGCGAIGLENVFATIAIGVMLRQRFGDALVELQQDLSWLWRWAEIVLFVSLGSAISLGSISGGYLVLMLVGVIIVALAIRVLAAYLLSAATELTSPERTYLAYSHLPKATIQAVFGAAPLIAFRAHGDEDLIGDGQTLLIMAVLAIIVTAPIGAVLLDSTANRLLCETVEKD